MGREAVGNSGRPLQGERESVFPLATRQASAGVAIEATSFERSSPSASHVPRSRHAGPKSSYRSAVTFPGKQISQSRRKDILGFSLLFFMAKNVPKLGHPQNAD